MRSSHWWLYLMISHMCCQSLSLVNFSWDWYMKPAQHIDKQTHALSNSTYFFFMSLNISLLTNTRQLSSSLLLFLTLIDPPSSCPSFCCLTWFTFLAANPYWFKEHTSELFFFFTLTNHIILFLHFTQSFHFFALLAVISHFVCSSMDYFFTENHFI